MYRVYIMYKYIIYLFLKKAPDFSKASTVLMLCQKHDCQPYYQTSR